jgi:hypothetical protein
MEKIRIKTDNLGFYYNVESLKPCKIKLRFFVTGIAGKFFSGEIQTRSTNENEWLYYHINFPVMQVGITSLEVIGYIDSLEITDFTKDLTKKDNERGHSISRREALRKAAATTFLIMGANTFSPFIPGQGAYGQRGGTFNPYDSRSSYSYYPYGTTYNY